MNTKKYSPYFSPFTEDFPEGLTFIPINDDTLAQFVRLEGGTPMDCVINAMQVLGLITNKEGGLLRVTQNATEFGFDENQISLLFKTCFYFDSGQQLLKDFSFNQFSEVDFETYINSCQHGQGLLCGIRTPELAHVFIVARRLNGAFAILDPQLDEQQICNGGWDCINFYRVNIQGGLYEPSQAQLFMLTNGPTYPVQ